MIIGINGRIGAGKDTVAKLIQYVTHDIRYPGVDISAEQYLKGLDWYYEASFVGDLNYKIGDRCGWHIKKFAGKLKLIASLLTGIEVENFEDQAFKQLPLGEEWNGMLVRTFLQKLGTECVRENLHTNTWVNALFADYIRKDGSTAIPNWIISDLRFPNEFDAVKEKGGITIRVERDNASTGTAPHISEIALDNHRFDYVIKNDGSIEELKDKVYNLLRELKLL